jgi:CRP/FNR family cyclic AMP-dependent transcriptional regulator
MNWGEIAGYVASALVFATFYMKTMLPLRLVAMASNVAFLTYALIEGLTPIAVLHAMLLPLNALRFLQMRELMSQVAVAARAGDFSVEAILPLMRRRRFQAGETLFARGDPANELYYVLEGAIFLPAVQLTIESGSFLGEFGLFSEAGVRTGAAIGKTDGTVMVLTRSAVFSCLLQHPQLGVHLLRLITLRMLQNAGLEPAPEETPHVGGPQPTSATGPLGILTNRVALRLAIAALAVVLVVAAIYQPLYIVLQRDAAVTTWLNVVTAPITGTIEGYRARVGQRIEPPGQVARIENPAADRSGVIHAESAVRAAETTVTELTGYDGRLAALVADWTDRRSRYGAAFTRDLELKIEDLEARVALLQDRLALAELSASRRRTLRSAGSGSQADADLAQSTRLELETSLREVAMTLERVRHRRGLASRGVFLLDDGKEPEWSWRSLDELRIEAARSGRNLAEARDALATAVAERDEERRNFEAATRAEIVVPDGTTIWSSSVANRTFVRQGEELFSWIDCDVLLVDAPVGETLATLLEAGSPAEVILEGDSVKRAATVLLTRGASSRLGKTELASQSTGHHAGTAQVIVALADPGAVRGCPIGRRAFVSFPTVRVLDYLKAYVPAF